MRTLYIECNMGAAGDMMMAALLELHPDGDRFVEKFNELGIPGVKLEKEHSVKCGITGTHMKVTVNGEEEESVDVTVDEHVHCHEYSHHEQKHHHEHMGKHGCHEHINNHEHFNHEHNHTHHHTSLHDIEHIIRDIKISECVKEHAISVYKLIAEAEGKAHGKTIEQIHFHEVGTMDAVADVVGVCMLIDELSVDKIIASPIHVGSGNVKCAHGILPVPAPATAYILKNVPIYGGSINGELCTPTGAALLKHFVDEFSSMPVMRIEKIGYGMGKKDFEIANCVRAMIGTCDNAMDDIVELCCNLDDMTGEKIGFVTELLMEQGALDVYTTAIGMKKNRPGIMLTCMCKKEDKSKFLNIIFQHTTTLGVREYICNRYKLERSIEIVDTKYGQIREKMAVGYGVMKKKLEYNDLARIAKEQNKTIDEIENELKK